MDNGIFCPVITSIQRIVLYETKNKYFIVGFNNNQTTFRMLKIDRTEPYDLILVDDKIEYSEQEVFQVLNIGNKGKASANKTVSAFGIVGFIRFLEGYYMILITKRRRIATIGLHVIYKIEDTSMIYIPHEHYRVTNSDEARYLKMFQSVDLSSNFYFSYSYDITHTLQVNFSNPKIVQKNIINVDDKIFGTDNDRSSHLKHCTEETVYGVRNKPNRKFVWNCHLLSAIENELHSEWILYVMHGFVGQSNVSIFGRQLYITLIARRSNKYAGTRFLKRGANFNGDVANEVETEQMVIDVGASSANSLRVSSFVQLRGSIPAQWSQDIGKMVTKPAIVFELSDPFYKTAGAHFNELMKRYGSPIIVLNLVKNREKKKHESQLSEEFNSAIIYLNQFLPPKHHIQYVTFDMARMNKGKEAKVMGRLAKIARSALSKTGLYLNNGPPINNAVLEKVTEKRSFQTGAIRVNCVDCLDRTNTAQFAVGKCALAYQLYYLGLLEKPTLEFDSDCVRLLEVLYEDHGDTLALQYGGSQLVHRIKTYRKTAPWTSQGNDIMQTLSRYYSNTFSDAEKQHAINLFLGLYVPTEHKQPIWEQNTDYYLHHQQSINLLYEKRSLLTQWWSQEVISSLPFAYNFLNKECMEIIPNLNKSAGSIDIFNHFHRTDEFTVIGETYDFKISHSVRDFMPRCVTDFSPFIVRIRPGRMREETSKSGNNMKNPSLTGQSSTSSANSTTSSSCGSDDGDDDTHLDSQTDAVNDDASSLDDSYGIELRSTEVGENDYLIYDRYALINALATGQLLVADGKSVVAEPVEDNFYSRNSVSANGGDSFEVPVPCASSRSFNIYKNFVETSVSGAYCQPDNVERYQRYVNNELGIYFPAVKYH